MQGLGGDGGERGRVLATCPGPSFTCAPPLAPPFQGPLGAAIGEPSAGRRSAGVGSIIIYVSLDPAAVAFTAAIAASEVAQAIATVTADAPIIVGDV